MRARALTVVALATVALSGCEIGTPAPDLFVVERAGSIPGAELRVLVSDGGNASCNGGPGLPMGSERLITARRISRELNEALADGGRTAYPPGAQTVLSYELTLEEGKVRFADSSPGITGTLREVQGFVRDIAKRVCNLQR